MVTINQHWYFISFATGTRFLGGVYIAAPVGEPDIALQLATARGLNPGGQALVQAVDHRLEGYFPDHPEILGRVLGKEETIASGAALTSWIDALPVDPTPVVDMSASVEATTPWDGSSWPPPIGSRVRGREGWDYGSQDCDVNGKRTAGTVIAEPSYIQERYRDVEKRPGVWAYVAWDGGDVNMYEATDLEPAPQN